MRLWTFTARAAILLAAIVCGAPAFASQGTCIMPTSGTVSGLTLVQDVNVCFDAIQTANSGATAPVNTAGAPGVGQLWLDTSGSPNLVLKIYDGSVWLTIGTISQGNHLWDPPIGGGSASVTSSGTVDLCSVPQSLLTITGTTTITSFSNTCKTGIIKALVFSGALTLTHNATSMILPNGGNNIVTAAGDRAWAVYLGTGNWNVLSYQRADGTALSTTSIFTGAVYFGSPLTPSGLVSNTNNWNPGTLSLYNVIRFSCFPSISITGIVAPPIDGQVIVLKNSGSVACIFPSESPSSTAGNRFRFLRDIAVGPDETLAIIYDASIGRWAAFSQNSRKFPTYTSLTSGSGATYSTPAGASRLKIRQCGAGGGGGGSGTSITAPAGAGGTTSFNSITAVGGALGGAGTTTPGAPGAGGTGGTGAATIRVAGNSGTPGDRTVAPGAITPGNGGYGGPGPWGGVGNPGTSLGSGAVASAANSCAGGSGAASSTAGTPGGSGGGSGEYVEHVINSPAASYIYTVGAAGTPGNGNGAVGASGGSGVIYIEEDYD